MHFFITVGYYFLLWEYLNHPIFSVCYEILCNSGIEEALLIFWVQQLSSTLFTLNQQQLIVFFQQACILQQKLIIASLFAGRQNNSRSSDCQSEVVSMEHLPLFFYCRWQNVCFLPLISCRALLLITTRNCKLPPELDKLLERCK